MEVLITKASHDTWHEYKDFNTIEELFNYINHCHFCLILKRNEFYKYLSDPVDEWEVNDLMQTWETDFEDILKINKTEWQIEIYDDYIE